MSTESKAAQQLQDAIDFAETIGRLPRCRHGKALKDGAGELLEPSCGCKYRAYSPGALRAGHNISERFRRALPQLPGTNAETLAAIIDAETGAPELLEALERGHIHFLQNNKMTLDDFEMLDEMWAAIAKARVTK